MKLLQTTAASVALATTFVVGMTRTVEAATLVGDSNSIPSLTATVGSTYRNTVSPDLASQLQATLDKTVQETGIPGAVVGIVSPQGTWYGASGLSNRETGTPMQLDNLFFTGSIKKTFTAATLLKLQEQGKLSLDDTLGKWLPEIASKIPDGSNITIRQLLNGSAGIYDFTQDVDPEIAKDPSILLSRNWQPEDAIAYAYGKPRYTGRTCSSVWCYTNTSSLIAEQIVEKATGSTYSSVLRNQVLEPLGMNHTFVAGEEEIPAQLVRGYTDINADGNLTDVTDYDLAIVRAAGGNVTSNAQDLIRFSQGLFGGELLKGESFNQMLTFVDTGYTSVDPGGEAQGLTYGLGVQNIFPTPWGNMWGKGGTNLGNEVEMQYFPDSRITAVTLVNGVNVPVAPIDILYTSLDTLFAQGQGNSQSIPESSATGGLMALAAVGLLFMRKQR